MELIIAFLLEKGGIFGILLVATWAWVWWTKTGRGKEKIVEKPAEDKGADMVSKIDLILAELADVKERVSGIEADLSTGSTTHLEHEKTADRVHDSVTHIGTLVKDLWDWHSVKDADGLPIWYVKRSLEERISTLSDTMKADAERLAQYSQDISKLNEDRIDELKEVITNYNKTILDLTMALERVRMTLETKGDK